MLLNVHGTCLQCSTALSAKLLLVGSPFSPYEVEATESQYYRLFEMSEEHAEETYASKVAYGTDLFPVGRVERHSELIPVHLFFLAVSQWRERLSDFREVVLSYPAFVEVFGSETDAVLVVSFVFVERIVLVDVLHVRCRLV